MNPNPWVELRKVAARDPALSDAGFRALSILIDWRISQGDLAVDLSEFPLPFSRLAEWLRISERQAYRIRDHLEAARYLKRERSKGVPYTTHFFLVSRSAKNGNPNPAKNGKGGSVRNGKPNPAKNGRAHTNTGISSPKNKGEGGGRGPGMTLAELARRLREFSKAELSEGDNSGAAGAAPEE